jgi:hypothetical protein
MKLMNSVKKTIDVIRKNFILVCGISLLLILFILQRSTKVIEGHNIGESHTHDNGMVHEGPMGDKGESGPRGDLGMRGKRGPPGVSGGLGSQGPPGEKGEKGERGMRGYRGKRGWRGPQGPSTFTEREEDLIRDAVRNSDTLTRGLAQTQSDVAEIKNALAEDYSPEPIFTEDNTEKMLVSEVEDIPAEELIPQGTEGFFSKIFGF